MILLVLVLEMYNEVVVFMGLPLSFVLGSKVIILVTLIANVARATDVVQWVVANLAVASF